MCNGAGADKEALVIIIMPARRSQSSRGDMVGEPIGTLNSSVLSKGLLAIVL